MYQSCALEAQNQYKRNRENDHWGRAREDNKIRKWAELMGILLIYRVKRDSAWRFKTEQTLIDEIVHAVGNARSGSAFPCVTAGHYRVPIGTTGSAGSLVRILRLESAESI